MAFRFSILYLNDSFTSVYSFKCFFTSPTSLSLTNLQEWDDFFSNGSPQYFQRSRTMFKLISSQVILLQIKSHRNVSKFLSVSRLLVSHVLFLNKMKMGSIEEEHNNIFQNKPQVSLTTSNSLSKVTCRQFLHHCHILSK